MSFRTRLTSFFVLIVVTPMLAVGFLVFRLISDSEQGKADARANGIATTAEGIYQSGSLAARGDAQTIARAIGTTPTGALHGKVAMLASQGGLARVTINAGARPTIDVGDPSAIAPGTAVVSSGSRQLVVTASELTASEYARQLSAPDIAVVVRQNGRTLASTLPVEVTTQIPRRGAMTVSGTGYRTVTQSFRGFGGTSVSVSVLSSLAATSTSVTGSRILAAGFIAAFLLLALSFSVLASRGLQRQLARFLQAARRLGSGDFSEPIPIEGHDEFAALGQEFNSMSGQLENRLEELSQERARLREAVRRIGQTFASNLDRQALLELALKTAMDAAQASCGRMSARVSDDQPLTEVAREGSFDGFQNAIYEAEAAALKDGFEGEAPGDGSTAVVVSVALEPLEAGHRTHGLITVARREHPFSEDDRALLRSLAAQATLALENVDLHLQVSRQAVTDELTGLSNHGRFQELLGTEMEQVRRYHHPVGLIMLDIDDFKSINDSYGHPQGDVVLRRVARVVADNSRDADFPARYGGEEMALILPHTDLEGAYAIAERARTAVEALRIPRKDEQGTLRITASLGVAATTDGTKDALIADADAALYEAKRQGKNRTVRAEVRATNVSGAG
jgi:diguanylate cyclase (GGDEF)-like protein